MSSSWFKSITQDLTASVKSAVSKIEVSSETLQKLTLTTPELRAEHQRIEEEERRKERVKNSLADLLPWETRDAERREILGDDCKRAILALSDDDATFFGPYRMPELNVQTGDDDDDDEYDNVGGGGGINKAGGEAHVVDGDGGDEDDEDDDDDEVERVIMNRDPTVKQLEILDKLTPLPPLLSDFDLDAHVGLIERLLKADPRLGDRQSILSGGGERERVFWQNYFVHCAFARYEAGLSIDEIWSETSAEDVVAAKEQAAAAAAAAVKNSTGGGSGGTEEMIVFDGTNNGDNNSAAAASAGAESSVHGSVGSASDALFASTDQQQDETSSSTTMTVTKKTAEDGSTSAAAAADSAAAAAAGAPSSAGSNNNDGTLVADHGFATSATADEDDSTPPGFEMVGASSGDPELDELEAEIARELED